MKSVRVPPAAMVYVEGFTKQIEELARQRDAALQMLVASMGLGEGPWKYEDGKLITERLEAGDRVLGPAVKAREAGDVERSLQLSEKALRLGVSDHVAISNMATCYGLKGNLRRAVELCDEALDKYPEMASPLRFERAFHHLRAGIWQAGWADWQFRTSRLTIADTMAKLAPGIPEWDGGLLPGGRLLMMAEGGIGDTIQYLRYLPLARANSHADIVVTCKSEAVRQCFVGIEGVTTIVGGDEVPDVGAWLAMWSLPHVLGAYDVPLPLDNFGTAKPRGEPWFLRVGICWHGDKDAAAAVYRPDNIDDWAPLLKLQGIDLISLQMGESLNRTPYVKEGFTLQDTADLIRTCDLVITCDGMIAHLAGSIGVVTWMVLHRYGYWPWEPAGETTVWYPSIRILRETIGWPDLFLKVSKMLQGAISTLEASNVQYPDGGGSSAASRDAAPAIDQRSGDGLRGQNGHAAEATGGDGSGECVPAGAWSPSDSTGNARSAR